MHPTAVASLSIRFVLSHGLALIIWLCSGVDSLTMKNTFWLAQLASFLHDEGHNHSNTFVL